MATSRPSGLCGPHPRRLARARPPLAVAARAPRQGATRRRQPRHKSCGCVPAVRGTTAVDTRHGLCWQRDLEGACAALAAPVEKHGGRPRQSPAARAPIRIAAFFGDCSLGTLSLEWGLQGDMSHAIVQIGAGRIKQSRSALCESNMESKQSLSLCGSIFGVRVTLSIVVSPSLMTGTRRGLRAACACLWIAAAHAFLAHGPPSLRRVSWGAPVALARLPHSRLAAAVPHARRQFGSCVSARHAVDKNKETTQEDGTDADASPPPEGLYFGTVVSDSGDVALLYSLVTKSPLPACTAVTAPACLLLIPAPAAAAANGTA